MAKVTPAEEIYCQGIAKGKTSYKAYCIAYPRQAKNSSKKTLYNNAYGKSKKGEIIARIEELRKPVIERFSKSQEDILRQMNDVLDSTMNKKKNKILLPNTAIRVLREQAKLQGFYKKAEEVGGVDHAEKLAKLEKLERDGKL